MTEPSRPLRVLFACPQSVLDISNGATQQCHGMLIGLSRIGALCMSFGGTIFSAPFGGARLPLKELKKQGGRIVTLDDPDSPPENRVKHAVFSGFASTDWDVITNAESTRFLVAFTEVLKTFRPDIVLSFGTDALSVAMAAERRRFGIPGAYVICNRFQKHCTAYFNDVLLTDSHVTAAFYRDTEGLDVISCGEFIVPERVRIRERRGKFVTFVSPSPAKGAALMAKLIVTANLERPDIAFQIVETHQTFISSLKGIVNPDGTPALQGQAFHNVACRPAAVSPYEIYENASVVVMPSVVEESWGRVATEAVMNGIPVLVSDRGGLPEAAGEGGIIQPLPTSMLSGSYGATVLPSDEEIRPWADALYRLADKGFSNPTVDETLERNSEHLLAVLTDTVVRENRSSF